MTYKSMTRGHNFLKQDIQIYDMRLQLTETEIHLALAGRTVVEEGVEVKANN